MRAPLRVVWTVCALVCVTGGARGEVWRCLNVKKNCAECAPSAPATPPAMTAPAPQATPTPNPTADSATPLDRSIDLAQASATETAAASQTVAPFMIGDSFGIGGALYYGYESQVGGVGATDDTNLGGGRQIKISENTSPMPRNRVFFLYNLFSGAYQTDGIGTTTADPGGGNPASVTPLSPATSTVVQGQRNIPLNRFTFGLEKTFFGGMMSAEVRIPIGDTIASDFSTGRVGIPGETAVGLDNVTSALKLLLYQTSTAALASGVVVNTPTANSISIRSTVENSDGTGPLAELDPVGGTFSTRLDVRNSAVYVSPYVGSLWTPTDRLFVQWYTQLELPLNGDRVTLDYSQFGQVLGASSQSVKPQALLHADLALGYWVYRNQQARWINAVAPLIETHYTTTTTNADLLILNSDASGSALPSSYRGIFGNTFNRLDIWNMTLGATILSGQRLYVTNAFVIPLTRGNGNNLFDWEYTLQLNYRYGSLARGNFRGAPFLP